ncbi:MAG TPA: SprT family zinc-dependent metalloprotease [Candidatus Cybelea sp.]|nr:SprT family zinc-dependent metalloprotease [Candidatus Cybelea sp.]
MRNTIAIEGRAVPLTVRISRRARRVSVRLNPVDAGVELVLPPRASLATGLRFAESQSSWIARRLAKIPPRLPFADGADVPILGVMHRICHVPGSRTTVRLEDGVILVGGRAEHLARRVRDWLRKEAQARLLVRAEAAAALVGRNVRRVRVREMKSRWGSCSANGALAFSWRLILAPEHVLDYVVAHEVAHLQEMNHGARFWAVVERLNPGLSGARAWLAANGNALHRYG